MPNIKKKILVAPLNWGLGHASRCIPIVRALVAEGFTPILASDGQAHMLLKKEFPELQILELPSYEIEYAKDGEDFKWKMMKNLPKMIDAVNREKKIVKRWVKEYNLSGIISDNRLGVISKKVPSVFITHQLNVLSGNTSWLSGKLHRVIISKFDECWVPDVEGAQNLSGKLGHLKKTDLNIKYIGPLSRFTKVKCQKKHELLVVLSGPEPQRTILEVILQDHLIDFDGKVLFIKGVVEEQQQVVTTNNITYYNYMTSGELEHALNQSDLVLCRSGYTTIMDLAKLRKKAFFIPTPGQFEQEYLAKRMKRHGFVPNARQENFRLENLLEADLYTGVPFIAEEIHWKHLFCLFESEREL